MMRIAHRVMNLATQAIRLGAAAAAIAVACSLMGATPLLAQRAITGKVTDRNSGLPVVSAAVTVEGTTVGATTRDDGTYRITQVPTGTRVVTARRVGYSP